MSERDHVAGSLDAPTILVEYGDFECPYCGRAHPVLQYAQRRLGKQLAFVFRHFPLTEIHPHAALAAEAAEAAGAQGQFWPMHDMLYEHQDALDESDLITYAGVLGLDITRFSHDLTGSVYARKVREDFQGGVRSGVNGTPTFFINGARFDGDWTDRNEFVAVLEQAQATTAR